MKKTYITTMPNKAGAFLTASEIISKNGGNIVFVNYNKSIDMHTLFIDVTASEDNMHAITKELKSIGYLAKNDEIKVILIVLKLPDIPGAVKPILEVLAKYNINISYMSSQENGTAYQYFKMGLLIENHVMIKKLLDELSQICEINILDYDITEKVLDSTVFYIGFANDIRNMLSLTQKQTNDFIISSNKIMQSLDERGESPLRPFEYIKKFAKFIVDHKGEKFNAGCAKHEITGNINLYVIQPPCGSNTFILHDIKNDELLFIDGGFTCFINEMKKIIYDIFPHFDNMKKSMVLTHADFDHVGIISLFNEVYVSEDTFYNFVLEQQGRDNFREQNKEHAPYSKISAIITNYSTPDLNKLKIMGKKTDDDVFSKIGEFEFSSLNFDVYEGSGGHVRGESVLVCESEKLAFTGDNIVNIKGFSKDQYDFNLLAPYLMRSVNANSELATKIRNILNKQLNGYYICPGHGAPIEKIL